MARPVAYYVYIMASSSGVLYTGARAISPAEPTNTRRACSRGSQSDYAVNKLVTVRDTRISRAEVETEREIKSWRREKKVA